MPPERLAARTDGLRRPAQALPTPDAAGWVTWERVPRPVRRARARVYRRVRQPGKLEACTVAVVTVPVHDGDDGDGGCDRRGRIPAGYGPGIPALAAAVCRRFGTAPWTLQLVLHYDLRADGTAGVTIRRCCPPSRG